MNVLFHDDARVEFLAQVEYYDNVRTGLGHRFYEEIEVAVARAARLPTLGSPYKFRTRRFFPKSFPFSVIYTLRKNEIVVVAIAHFRQKPGYWRKRVQ